jgi:hypothetical protein
VQHNMRLALCYRKSPDVNAIALCEGTSSNPMVARNKSNMNNKRNVCINHDPKPNGINSAANLRTNKRSEYAIS